jgi:polyketide cyclase/dehydrase/lipid transport protein
MPSAHVAADARIAASAERVYSIIADYRDGHPHILPKPYFSSLEVDRGGIGAGTVIRFQMHVLGVTRELRGEVTEPQPGRVLVESYPEDGSVTTFTIDPEKDGQSCHIMITTDFNVRGGPFGWIQAWATRMMLRKIYKRELAQLAEFATRQQAPRP